jgi:hypothetical protein
LFLHKAKPPLKPSAILLQAQAMFDVDKEDFKSYLLSFGDLEVGEEVGAIAQSAREKALLVRLINEAGSQLAKGQLDVNGIKTLVESNARSTCAITAMASTVHDTFPETPVGIPLRSLPALSAASNGLIGVWIVGGEPGLGKSTLAFQIALDAAAQLPVIYYDLDGTGQEWLLDRVRRITGSNLKLFRKFTERLYLRETINTLSDDIAYCRDKHDGAKTLVVVDSLQTLPSSIKYKKESLDSWINKFKQLTKEDVVVLAVSEQNRAAYGEAKMSGFKGSGDIEYAGSLCVQLLQDEDDNEDDPVQLHIVKNRHGKRKGHIIDLERDHKKVFWFNEEEL